MQPVCSDWGVLFGLLNPLLSEYKAPCKHSWWYGLFMFIQWSSGKNRPSGALMAVCWTPVDSVTMQSEVSSQKQEVKVFVISPIHHPETAQAAICWCLGAATAERSSHISLRLTVIINSLCWAKLSLHESWSSRGHRLLVAEPAGEQHVRGCL